MKLNYKSKTVLFFTFFIIIYCNAQAPAIEWQKFFGGTANDRSAAIHNTNDGGYIITGSTYSNDGDVTGNHGSSDYWVVKLTSTGTIEWQKTLGGTNIDECISIQQTNEGGYIVCGYSISNDIDISGNNGYNDIWVVKLTSTGIIEWQKTLGGSNGDYGGMIQQTNEGGYIISGNTYSNDGDVDGHHGIENSDAWIVKLTPLGIIEWQKTLGGSNDEYGNSIQQTNDGGYIFTGHTSSNDGDVSGNHGGGDFWVVKLTSTGTIEWQKTLGGSQSEHSYSIQQTNDGGYIVAGNTSSNDGDVTGNNFFGNIWVVKLTSLGIIEWQKTLGGSFSESAVTIKQTIDNSYIVSGVSSSNEFVMIGNNGYSDIWIVKLTSIGDIQWQKAIGGTSGENVYPDNSIQITTDGGYIVCGYSNSNDINVTGNHGGYDILVVKFAPDNLGNTSFTENTTITLFPNPTKEKITLKLDYFNPSQEITITDIQGKIIHNQKLESVSTTINTSSFEKGIYFLNLINSTQKTTKKFIVE